MSKVKYYYVEEYACDCLERLRKMHETRDYSQLLATVERLQQHVNAMESGLGKGYVVERILNTSENPPAKVEKIAKLFDLVYNADTKGWEKKDD